MISAIVASVAFLTAVYEDALAYKAHNDVQSATFKVGYVHSLLKQKDKDAREKYDREMKRALADAWDAHRRLRDAQVRRPRLNPGASILALQEAVRLADDAWHRAHSVQTELWRFGYHNNDIFP